MESGFDHHSALEALAWQFELGADEAISDAPINRYELAEAPPVASAKPAPAAPAPQPAAAQVAPVDELDPVVEARKAAARAHDLEALRAELAEFAHCELRRGAKSLVFSDGDPKARVMILGEAPGREEDQRGKPFVGRAGQLLDRMFEAIGLSRTSPDAENALYITNVLPWRPPQNRDPLPEEIAMMLPFVKRHIELAAPDVVVLMGNISCQAMLGRRGITRLRGTWDEVDGRPVLPMFHPAYLLRQPAMKRLAWQDLLSIKSHLDRS